MFFQKESENIDLDRKNYIFQAKTKLLPDYEAIEREVQARRSPESQREDPNYLFARLSEVAKTKRSSNRQLLQKISGNRIQPPHKPKNEDPVLPRQRMGLSRGPLDGPESNKHQSDGSTFIFLNNSAFLPRFQTKVQGLEFFKKMRTKFPQLNC
jgi:hypothetical protein